MINSAKRKMKAEGKRIYVKALLITLISLMCSVRAWSQAGVIYPVDINVTLTPPYGTCLTDLTNSDRFRIQALMRDMSHPEYEMVIQMMVRDLSSLSPVFISTTNAFSLTAGQPTKVIGRDVSFASIADFFNYQNIRMGMQYVGSKCLPEGAYLFSFQAFDAKSYRTNRIPISREVTFSAFLEGGEVPILISPAQKDSIKCGVQSIHFTWMQPFVSSGVNTYRLQVLKSNTDFPLPAKGLLDNPNTNDRLEVTTMIPSYTYNNTSNFLEKNKTYYWRVVMCDADGNARLSYPNKGASEIRSFVYCGDTLEPDPDPFDGWKQEIPQAKTISEKLDTVKLLRATEDGPDVVRAFCGKDVQEIREKYSGIIVEVKKKSHDTWTPFSIESKSVEDTSVALGNLAYNELYQARAQYYINEGETTTYAPYSETIEFTISNPADTMECGTPLPELNSDCTGKELKELKEGDKFTANGVKVTILEVTSQSVEGEKLKISGTGYVDFPILRNFKLKVKFDNAVLNCNLQLEDGTVESVHDLSTAATIDLNNLTGKGAGGYDLPETNPSIVNMPNIDPNNPSTYESYEPGTLFSKDGEIYLRTEEGIIAVGKSIDLSTSGDYESNETRDDKVLVWFSNPDPANIAFDNDSMGYYRNIPSIQEQYVLFAKNYIIPWVANNPGRVVTLKAKPDAGYENSGYTDLKFVLKTSSTDYVELNNQLNGDGSYNVDIPGTDPSNITHIYVIARPSADKPYENVGRLKVACYKKKTQKVILVPVADINPDAKEVNTYLTSVYGKLGYSFEVEVDNDKSHVTGIKSDQINISSGVFTQYSDELKSIINTYTGRLGNSYDKSAAYLFLMKKASDDNASVGGIMPQKNQFGFIFLGGTSSVNNRTIAHELGHGLWGLDHTFDSYKIPDNSPHLMDYNNGVYLAHFEWSQIDKPVKSWALFNSDKDNEGKGIKAKIAKCVGKSFAKVLIDKAGEQIFDAIVEGFLTGDTKNKNKNSVGFDISVSSISSFTGDVIDDILDGDCLKKEELGDLEVIKDLVTIVSFISDAYDCYANAQSQAELDVCLCKVFASQGLDIITGFIGGLIDGLAEAEKNKRELAARIEKIRIALNDYLNKHKVQQQIVSMSGEQLEEFIKTKICGATPEEPEMGKNAEDFFNVEYLPWKDKFEIKVLTKQEGLTRILCKQFDIDGKLVGKPIELTKKDVAKCSDRLNYYTQESYVYDKSDSDAKKCFDNVLNNIINKVSKEVCDDSPLVPIMTTCHPHFYSCYCFDQFTRTDNDRNGYTNNENTRCYCSTEKVYYTYDLFVKCPEDGGHYEFSFYGQITDKEGGIFSSETTKSELVTKTVTCTKQAEVQTPPSEKPKSIYPIYVDDECNCNDPAYKKNPFGQIKQTGPNTYENSSPRETIEGKSYEFGNLKLEYGIPKCSGWKEIKTTEDGCKIYSVSPRVKCGENSDGKYKYIPNLYTVTICNNKVKDIKQNNVKLSPYAFEILEYWHDKYCIVLDNGNNNYAFMDLQEFCETINSKDVLIDAFITMYACWEYNFIKSGSTASVGVSNTIPDLKDYVRSICRLISLSNKSTNILPGIDKVNIKFIENTRDLLPPNVLQDIKKALNEKKPKIESKDLKKCPANCVFAEIMLKTAQAFAEIKYNDNNAKAFADKKYTDRVDDDLSVQRDVLVDYLSILGWKLYCGKIPEGVNYHGMEMGSWRNPPYGILELSDKGAQLFKYTPGLDPDNAKIKTFPDVLMKYLEGKKCK